MTDLELLEMARAEGFNAAMIEPENIPVNSAFRAFCEENRCGKYNANYSCPPDCGTVEELRAKTLAEDATMVITTKWEIGSYENKEAIQKAKKSHTVCCLDIICCDRMAVAVKDAGKGLQRSRRCDIRLQNDRFALIGVVAVYRGNERIIILLRRDDDLLLLGGKDCRRDRAQEHHDSQQECRQSRGIAFCFCFIP